MIYFFSFLKGLSDVTIDFAKKNLAKMKGVKSSLFHYLARNYVVNHWILPRNACMIVPKNLVKTKGVKSSLFGGKLVNLWISILP